MASYERREFDNKFPSYDGKTILLESNGKVTEPFYSRLKGEIVNLLRRCEEGFEHERDDYDYSVYTGTAGMALLYLRLAASSVGNDDPSKRQQYLEKGLNLLDHTQHNLRGKRMTFLCGDTGVLAVCAVLYDKLGKQDKSERCITKLQSLCDRVCHDKSLPDEVLYGRAGYLFSLLFIQQNLGQDKIDTNMIDQVCQAIITSGEKLSKHEHSRSPLMYTWHDKHYIGAAHGIVGIIYMLLQATSAPSVQAKMKSIEGCVEYLLSQQFPSGNMPSSLESGIDKLMHWCHGAPGAVHLMMKAYQVFGKDKYLSAALKCGEVIWQKGLLKKGYGICHGVSGNAYAFLSLYKQTNNPMYLHRAMKFAEWCFDYGKHGCRTPDTPYSLFEGMAGTVYFLVDLLEPRSARFPAFDV